MPPAKSRKQQKLMCAAKDSKKVRRRTGIDKKTAKKYCTKVK